MNMKKSKNLDDMTVRETCFFCCSPYQFFPILGLAYQRKEAADLYIDPQFDGAGEFAQRIRDLNIFNNVIVIDANRIYKSFFNAGPGLKNHFQIANTYFHVKEIAEMILISGIKYNNIFLSSRTYLARMVYLYYLQNKWVFNLYYFDDGAGTYDKDRAFRIKKADKVIRRLLFGQEAIETNHNRFVFSPEIYKMLNNNDNKVFAIDRFWGDLDGLNKLNYIFNVPNNISIKEKMIILDQPREELFDEKQNNYINSIYLKFAEAIGYENVVLKKHPRSGSYATEYIRIFDDKGIPFEVYCMNSDMSDKIIVTYSSTAAATPKILFDQEPIVIVLTKLIEPVTGERNLFEDFFNAVRNTYRDPNKFFIPSKYGEYDKIIEILKLC